MNAGHESRISKNISKSNEEHLELRKGPWTIEEDNLLIKYIDAYSEGRWNALAQCAGLKRTGKSCRLRWLNYLKPGLKRGNLTPQDQLLILELHSKWGNRWSKIAQYLPGRTDNEIKNYWRTRVQKQARTLNVDANSKTFIETLKCYWMPRLLEKVEQNNASFSIPPSCPISTIENQDSTFLHFEKPHEISTSVSQNNGHQEKSNLSNYSNNFPSDYQKAMNLPEIQENMTVLSPSWKSIHSINSIQSDCYSTQKDCYSNPNVFRYSEECLSQQAMTSSEMGRQEMCFSDYDHITHDDCFNHDERNTFWDAYDLWEFRNTEGVCPE